MAVVRCPIHNIPYNDRNPRGCPACHAEKQGEDPNAALMRELARASRAMVRPDLEDAPAATAPPVAPAPSGPGERQSWPPPVTTPPRVPVPERTRLQKLWYWAVEHRTGVLFTGALAVAGSLLWVITRPDYVQEYDPPFVTGTALPVPVEAHMPIEGVFARLGTQPPLLNADSRDLARYYYPGGVHVDALNGVVYAVTLNDGGRAWKGNRVGVSEPDAMGTLALLGTPREREAAAPRAPVRVGSYQVYTTATDRPRRTLAAEVRPPNGCYDVLVVLAPRILGRLAQGDGSVVVVARRGDAMQWVAVQVRVVSRALPGPYAGRPVCPLPES